MGPETSRLKSVHLGTEVPEMVARPGTGRIQPLLTSKQRSTSKSNKKPRSMAEPTGAAERLLPPEVAGLPLGHRAFCRSVGFGMSSDFISILYRFYYVLLSQAQVAAHRPGPRSLYEPSSQESSAPGAPQPTRNGVCTGPGRALGLCQGWLWAFLFCLSQEARDAQGRAGH